MYCYHSFDCHRCEVLTLYYMHKNDHLHHVCNSEYIMLAQEREDDHCEPRNRVCVLKIVFLNTF